MSDYPIRPQTPQAMLHRLPDKPYPSSEGNTKDTQRVPYDLSHYNKDL
jgi:hypothetical protein